MKLDIKFLLVVLFLAQLVTVYGAPVESDVALSVQDDHDVGMTGFEDGELSEFRLGKRQARRPPTTAVPVAAPPIVPKNSGLNLGTTGGFPGGRRITDIGKGTP
ncbi:hypothetical protein BKA69DRAFT_1037412 [Paraphysoderma sedebokerense]|nr:hypothetical protein BKA69DRAFT_1037412 [Paraphysoderma sedebokerense]